MMRLMADGVSPKALAAPDRLPCSATMVNTSISPERPPMSICASCAKL